MEPENLHFTIKFLGEVPAGQIPALQEIATTVALRHRVFEAEIRSLGAFPTVRRPEVIWVGVGQGRERLEKLGRDLIQSLANARLTVPESRPFVAHCTLARVKDAYDPKALTEILQQEADFVGGNFRCDALELIRSTLTRQGPVYERVARMPLED